MGVSPAAYETEALKAYVAEFPPALVARNQLENAVAEFSTFETARVRDGLNNAIQSALTGAKEPTCGALGEAQAAAVRLLADIPVTSRRGRCVPCIGPAFPNNRRRAHVRPCQSRTPQTGHLWLAFAVTCRGVADGLCVLPVDRDPLVEHVFTRHPPQPTEFVGTENYAELFADPTFWIVVKNNLALRGRHNPRFDFHRAVDGALGQWQDPRAGFVRTAYFTPTVLPMIAAANLWLFFYTPGLGRVGPDRQPVWPAFGQLAGPARNRALGDHHRDNLERGGVLHDLLPRRIADNSRRPQGSRRHRGHQPLDLYAPHRVAAVDADDAVHRRQRHDQLGQADRPFVHPDQGRAVGCLQADPLLHLRDGLCLL